MTTNAFLTSERDSLCYLSPNMISHYRRACSSLAVRLFHLHMNVFIASNEIVCVFLSKRFSLYEPFLWGEGCAQRGSDNRPSTVLYIAGCVVFLVIPSPIYTCMLFTALLFRINAFPSVCPPLCSKLTSPVWASHKIIIPTCSSE